MSDRIQPRTSAVAAGALVAVLVCGCSATSPTPTPVDASPPGDLTLRSLIDAAPESPTFEPVRQTTDDDGDPAEIVSYESGGLTVQATIRRPAQGSAPLPAIVLVHGSVDPDEYSGLTHYDEFADEMVSRGFVVVMPDLRNHGDSDDAADWETEVLVGSTLDAINAVRAAAADGDIDADRIAMAGHSSGGAITVNAAVVAPEIAAIFIAVAPSSSSAWRNVERFSYGTPSYDRIVAAHGSEEESPGFWKDVSSLTFVDRAEAPLLIVHGTADNVVPFDWSQDLVAAWEDAGKDIELVPVTGGDHFFETEDDSSELYETIASHLP